MSWVSTATRRFGQLLAAVAMALPGMALAAIVVASTGPSARQFPAGKKLSEDARITLQKGDSVTVLDKRGTRVLRGPGRFSVSKPGRPIPNPAFAILTRQRSSSRVTVGAVRTGEDGKPLSPNLWYVDVARPGTKCVANPDNLSLWRADAEKPAQFRISSADGAESTVSFGKDATLASWDTARAPVADGATYRVADKDGDEVGELRFVLLPDPPADEEALALALIGKGCTAQVELLSAHLSISRM
ncbi:MAG: hypothetical protein R3E09_02095 [Novosphingobium sp.]